jgi:hypothetical protein
MFYTDILNENEFNRALELSKGMESTFLYSCGSETSTPQGYISNQFTRHIHISERPAPSKACGMNASIYVELNNKPKKSFLFPEVNQNMKFGDCLFIRYLIASLEANTLMNVFKDDLIAYAYTCGFEPGVDTINNEQKNILKSSYDVFMFKRFKGTLDDIISSPETMLGFDSIEVMEGSVESEIASMILNGQRIDLPSTKLKHYSHIKTLMQRAGGKYLKLGFEFSITADLPAIMLSLVKGEEYNPKKLFQFFGTNDTQSAALVADVNLKAGDTWLEPSAGQASVANLARKISNKGVVIELMDENVSSLIAQGYDPIQQDFLTVTPEEIGLFNKIIANPPFTKNSDIKHVSHMFNFLENNGKLASIMSMSWRESSHKVAIQFRDWIDYLGADVVDIPAGEFKGSGTNVATCKIIFTKSTGAMGFDEFVLSLRIAA